ncbi:MAG: ABC transporter permease [Lachnospiraceae bacterium]|jgi:multidrug/hemolysin transport system permease protein|nr:ABC transporter permease [Lachnospiraceae bacterium]
MINLGMRNFRLYVREKGAVFFSMLGVFIIIGLYILFLGDGMKEGAGDLPGKEGLIDTWVMAGVIAVSSITTSMGACGVIIEDRVKKRYKDFMSAPLRRSQIVGGYVYSACLVGGLMCTLTFIAVEIYLVVNGGALPSVLTVAKVLGIIALAVTSSASIVLFISSLLKTNGAFNNVSILLGTLIGFITGIYLPIGSLGEGVQWIIKCFPVSHAGALLRQVLMEDQLNKAFTGMPVEAVDQFKEEMGIVFRFGDTTAEPEIHVVVLILTTVIFLTMGVLNMSRKEK